MYLLVRLVELKDEEIVPNIGFVRRIVVDDMESGKENHVEVNFYKNLPIFKEIQNNDQLLLRCRLKGSKSKDKTRIFTQIVGLDIQRISSVPASTLGGKPANVPDDLPF